MNKIYRNKKGVSEIVGTILLLGMAIALFVGVHIVALNIIPYSPNALSVRISGEIKNDTIYLQHNGGDSIPPNTKIIFSNSTTGDTIINEPIGTKWNIGEVLKYTNQKFNGTSTLMIIIDVESNAIIAQDIFYEVKQKS